MATTEGTDRSSRLREIHAKFLVEQRTLEPAARRQLFIISAVLVLVGTLGFVVSLVSVLRNDGITVIDMPIRDWLMSGRSATWTPAMLVLSFVFGPLFFPYFALVIAVTWVVRARHLWRQLLLAVATAVGVVAVRVIAEIVGRPRPPAEDMLTDIDSSESFPSGHVIGASIFIFLIAYLVFSRRQAKKMAVISFVVATLAVVATALSRMYLGYHWATDVIGAISLALIALGAVIAVDTWRTTTSRQLDATG